MAFEEGSGQRLLTKHSPFWQAIDSACPHGRFQPAGRHVLPPPSNSVIDAPLTYTAQDSADGTMLGWRLRWLSSDQQAPRVEAEAEEAGLFVREIYCLASVLRAENRPPIVPVYVVQRYEAVNARFGNVHVNVLTSSNSQEGRRQEASLLRTAGTCARASPSGDADKAADT